MGLIKGITIKLTEADGTESEIEDVLVTPSVIAKDQQAEWNLGGLVPDYTIAIPKTDTHEWIGARAGFFGEEWEVVALSGVTIDRLTPLSWNQRAYAIRGMSDKLTLRTARGRTRSENGIYQSGYKEVEVDALADPAVSEATYAMDRAGQKQTRRVVVRQADFDGAGAAVDGAWHEPKEAEVGGVRYAVGSYERIGTVVMLLTLVREA